MPELKIVNNGETTSTFPLSGEKVSLGRDARNTVVLRDKTASSSHAQISLKPEGYEIEDLRSTNGTMVNGWPIESVLLRDGDRIQIGAMELLFSDEEQWRDRGPNADDYQQSVFATFAGDEEDQLLPSLIIDDRNLSRDGDEGMSFIGVSLGGAGQVSAEGSESPVQRTVDLNEERRDESSPSPSPQEHVAETKLRLVQQVSEQLVRIFDPQQLLDEIMTIVVQQTGADRGLLCLLDEKRQPIPIAARGTQTGEEIRVSRTVLGRLLNGRSGVLINAEEPAAMQSLAEMKVQSTMCAPLWTGDRIVGILSLDSMTIGKNFSQQDLELLLAVAHPVAVGIERNRLSHQIESERKLRDYMSQYLDHRVVEQISHGHRTGNDPLAPSEYEVTILFSDIVSFTKMSESLSAVELAEFMHKYLSSMTDVVFAHGGTIDKYIGDAVMALFGAPVPSADSAEAAIRAALQMQRRIKDFQLPGAKGKNLRVRVGINTGPVVVGNLGSDRRREYTALGDAVNVASRLETFARPNEICIDELTHAKTKDAFEFEEIGTIDVKNRAEPVIVYKVIGERGERNR